MEIKRVVGVTMTLFCLAGAVSASPPENCAKEAFAFRMQGRAREALGLLEAGLDEDPAQGPAQYELARTCLYLMDFSGMREASHQAVSLEPDEADFRIFAGLAMSYSVIDAAHRGNRDQMKEFAEAAIAELGRAVQMDPGNFRLRYQLIQQSAALAGELGTDPGPLQEQAAELQRRDPVFGARALSLFLERDRQIELWEEIIAEHGSEPRAMQQAAEAFLDLEMPDRAAECLDWAMAGDTGCAVTLMRLGNAFAMKGDLVRAESLTRRYLQLDPPVPLKAHAMAKLGNILIQMGKPAEGKELVDKARSLDPDVWQTFMPPPEELFSDPEEKQAQ